MTSPRLATHATRCLVAAALLAVLLFGTAACGRNDKQELTVVGTEMAFDAPSSAAPGSYEVRFENRGAVYHEVAIKDATGEVLRRVSAAPGAVATMDVTLAGGRYELGCFEPGHYEAGMHRLLTVR